MWVSQNEGIYERKKLQTRVVITRVNAMQVGVGGLEQEGRSTNSNDSERYEILYNSSCVIIDGHVISKQEGWA
jgi:hypothetical protein